MYYIVFMKLESDLVWDDWNREHIKKHNVEIAEVEDIYKSKFITEQSYQKRILILGRTNQGRLLTIVISDEKQENPYVVSARDMSVKERRYFYEKTKTYKTI